MAGRAAALLMPLAAVLVAGCSAEWYTHDADREVYGIVAEKEADALGRVRRFNVRPRPDPAEVLEAARAGQAAATDANGKPPPAERLPEPGGVPRPDVPGPAGGAAEAAAAEADRLLEKPVADLADVIPAELPPPVPEPPADAVHLTMAEALRVAAAASRAYQAQKETVYLSALALTLERYLFRPHPTATGTVDHMSDFQDGTGRVRSWDPGAEVGVSQQLADGAVVAGSLGVAALKYLNKELGDTVDSALDFSLTQPLWRGAGRRIVQENLLQAERNALYTVR
ncbi:MAG: hypothetical protein U9R68_07375, partial [Planctomycetota bacterium]|nr:hypothetical protein [Planctomycetota bacterium]